MQNKFIVSSSPHLHKDTSIRKIMWAVVISLIPAAIAGVFIFGLNALWIILLGVLTSVFTEWLCCVLTKRKVNIFDASAVITGLLLSFNLSSAVPLWMPVVGAFVSIAIGKQVFGGLGQNIFNPALVGRVFLMASWPRYMTTFLRPFDTVSSATPLAALKEGKLIEHLSYLDLFLGRRGGCIGEVCIAALLLGAAFLWLKGYISLHIPLSYIATTGIFCFVFGAKPLFTGDWFFHILNGGLILGAFYMATDYVTSPLTYKGQIIFGVGCGLITAVIRLWGGYPEGVSYAILMMNAATPIIDRYTRQRVYGTRIKISPAKEGV